MYFYFVIIILTQFLSICIYLYMYLSIYSISIQLDFSPKLCSPTHMYDIHKWNHVISEGHVASGVCAAAQRIISDVQVRHHLCAASAAGQSGASSCIIPSSLFFCVACVSSSFLQSWVFGRLLSRPSWGAVQSLSVM